MDSTVAGPNSPTALPHLIGKNYEIALNQSIEALLTDLGCSNSENSSSFTSEFRKLMQSRADPSLEAVWAFAALSFSDPDVPKTDPLDRIQAIRNLLQLIVSCTAASKSVKSIALAAPVVFHLHSFILDFKGFQLGPKKERKIKREIRSLVDSVIGYINVCCDGSDGDFDDSEDLMRPMGDLVRFWIVGNGIQNQTEKSLRVFFPLLTDDIVKRLSVEGCGMADVTSFVAVEAFLLKLCWKIQAEGFGEKLLDELRSWMVGSISGLQNSYLYVTLLSMLLEPVLPITSLVDPEHEASLRKVLFDALILVEYSFLKPESLDRLPVKLVKRIVFTKLIVTDDVIELSRKQGEQKKAILYLNAFASSSLPSQINKCIKNKFGNEISGSEPSGSSPRAFLRWMLNIENRGIKIFDDDMSKFRAKLISYSHLNDELEKFGNKGEGKNTDSNLLFFIDNKGQEEPGNEDDDKLNQSMSAAFMAAAHSMLSSENGERKRKTRNGGKSKPIKFIKYNLLDNSSLLGAERSAAARNDDSNSGSDVDDRESDEEMD